MRFRQSGFLLLALFGVAIASCAQETYPSALLRSVAARSAEVSATKVGPIICRQASAEAFPARLVAMSAQTAPTGTPVFVDDLFNSFNSGGLCGGCHGSTASQGGFQIANSAKFAGAMTSSVLGHVLSNGGLTEPEIMPPIGSGGKPYSQRLGSDSIKQFADLVTQWIAAGTPQSFTPAVASAIRVTSVNVAVSAASFVMAPDIGNTMTNIGSCIPTPALVAVEEQKSQQLDSMFASAMPQVPVPGQPAPAPYQMMGLPEHLGETDLISLDSSILAQYGVIAYAPGYPLWSDNSGKLRYVRVPRNASIHFNKGTQAFEIPPNTRFYKTFMRQIIDVDGSRRWRKIETRLIVSRPDRVDAHGKHTQTALYGTYQWTDDESDAVLIESLRNNLTPFPDTLLRYNTNEPLAANIESSAPANLEDALLTAHAVRHYAIPSSDRCVECHMGSPSAEFVLGFTPLQIARRPTGEGGVIEETGPDELTQLQRFIDYGLITGIDSVSDVLPLEESQGTRTARNEQELIAQGYLLGNCAHCHNPIGFPTVQNPVLKSVLDFLPSQGPLGGIFQLPLELYSPRIARGTSGVTPIPYITPSLMDQPRYNPLGGQPVKDPFAANGIFAPWRSLIYRNVDDAFSYTDDYTLYPHMPFNTAGYDPRVKQIVSDWMVSIPAVRKKTELQEYFFFGNGDVPDPTLVDASPQPYVEVTPGSPGYDQAFLAAQQRLAILHTGSNPAVPSPTLYSRYADPDDTADILDPAVHADPTCHPVPTKDATTLPEARHPHWVITDLTSPAGPWVPRRGDWATFLANGGTPSQSTSCASSTGTSQAYTDQLNAIALMQTLSVDSIRSFATTPVPFGLWSRSRGCDFTSPAVQNPSAWPLTAPPVSAFSTRPHWFKVANPKPDDPVYMQTPGQAVFKMICINCHGPQADGKGRMADNLATITGGNARVADFREGLFGPLASPGANIQRVFGGAGALDGGALPQWAGFTAEERAAHYMPWMALGGTLVNIPTDILTLVAQTKVLDQPRTLTASSLSANMLSEAKAICESFLGQNNGVFNTGEFTQSGGYLYSASPNSYLHIYTPDTNYNLLTYNGDAELWLTLCTLNNPPPIHILARTNGKLTELNYIGYTTHSLALDDNPHIVIRNASYPPNMKVGNDQGIVDLCLSGTAGCTAETNLWPWCVTAASTDEQAALSAGGLPPCPLPAALTDDAGDPWWMTNEQGSQWALRGAINAGMSVFLYLEWLETQSQPPPDFNQCQLLP